MENPGRRPLCHRSGSALYFGGQVPTPERPLPPGVEAWVEANRGRFAAGEVVGVAIIHDAECRYPRGEACTCAVGPEIRVVGEDPETN